MILHSPGPSEVYAGPYTYKRFWFRDAALIAHAMLCSGLIERAESILRAFFKRQNAAGYFLSQDGEWDSNGQVLWILKRLCDLKGERPDKAWKRGVLNGGRWILRKLGGRTSPEPFTGLMPAGFSAEHLGPNDHYYWDDYWSVAGLQAASGILSQLDDRDNARLFEDAAQKLSHAIERSLRLAQQRIGKPLLPAAPGRRMDTGAVGSLAACYPLQLYAPADRRVVDTAEYLLSTSIVKGAFFHDISHSGINPYLTMYISQSLLRAGDERFLPLAEAIADLASPTGQWPEAIHPLLGTGCMGDGQHVWASSEWIMMVRNMFVREEEKDGRLVLCSGIPEKWLVRKGGPLFFGPAPTMFGSVSITVAVIDDRVRVSWEARWHSQWSEKQPPIEVRFPWAGPIAVTEGNSVVIPLNQDTAVSDSV